MKNILFFSFLVLFLACSKAGNDDELLTTIQKQTFRYFWDFGHPVSGLARERSNTEHYGHEVVTTGGSGFGVMAIIVGIERKFITYAQGVDRVLKIVSFLAYQADRYHGVWPHWINGETGKTISFSQKDNGADLVETAFMFQGLLAAHQYFSGDTEEEKQVRSRIDKLWREAEWSWFTKGGEPVLYWHWSPDYGWEMNHRIRGYNECHIAYILAAASPTWPIDKVVYDIGWAGAPAFKNGKSFYGITLPLGPDSGGPLFWAHYSYLGLDPRGLQDEYANYWEQNMNYTLINRQYCITNPFNYEGYGEKCWGLTASDGDRGYSAHSPRNDRGVIAPTAALSSFPYTPEYSMEVLKYLYYELGDKMWGEYGFKDAFNIGAGWYADSYLAIDQGPIIIMIENYRTGLLWKLFMSHPDVKQGLSRLGIKN